MRPFHRLISPSASHLVVRANSFVFDGSAVLAGHATSAAFLPFGDLPGGELVSTRNGRLMVAPPSVRDR